MTSEEKQLAAAERMEEIAADLTTAAKKIRDGIDDFGSINVAYGMAYEIRKQLGYVVATLGFGVPRRSVSYGRARKS